MTGLFSISSKYLKLIISGQLYFIYSILSKKEITPLQKQLFLPFADAKTKRGNNERTTLQSKRKKHVW